MFFDLCKVTEIRHHASFKLYRGQNIHKVSIQLDLGWLVKPNSKALFMNHDKNSMNNCCCKKNIFIDKVHICVSHEFVDTTLKVQKSSDLAVDGTRSSITTTLSRGSCNRRYYLARGCNFLADKPYINISNLDTKIIYSLKNVDHNALMHISN